MIRAIVTRLLLLVAMLWTAATVNFVVPRLTDRDPIAERLMEIAGQGGGSLAGVQDMVHAYQARFGLDQPLWSQYLRYLDNLLHLDLGYSIANYPTRVADQIAYALPWTIALLGTSTLIAFVAGTMVGALAAWPRAPRIFRDVMPLFIVLSAIPFYLVGLVLVYFIGFRLGWLPSSGGHDLTATPAVSLRYIQDVLLHALLPAFSIVIASVGTWALGMRGMMVGIQGEDYMVFADAKGLRPSRKFFLYGMRNALLPQVTALAMSLGRIITGSVLVEMVFAYPGIGTLLFQSIKLSDFFTIYGCVLVLVAATGLSMIAVDLLYPLLDPRVRVANG
jgi:peptide/nickel transport system permease protein